MAAPSIFLAALRRALLLDFERELVLSTKVAIYQAAGYRRSDIARMITDASPAELRAAEIRVKRASERLDAGND